MQHILPLYAFFNSLQELNDFQLGIEEYKALIEVLQKDNEGKYFVVPNPEEDEKKRIIPMLKLCKLLWLKPNQNTQLFEKLFYLSFNYLKRELEIEEKEQSLSNENKSPNDAPLESRNIEKDELPSNLNPKENEVVIDNEDTGKETEETQPDSIKKETLKQTPISEKSLYLNFKEGITKGISGSADYQKDIRFVRNYVSFHQRYLLQSWRFLQKTTQHTSFSAEIDINHTIKNIAEHGLIDAPIYTRKKQNNASLITFIDHKGSMIAFKHLALSIAKAAQKGANIQNKIYFFRNTPPRYNDEDETKRLLYVYENQGQTQHCSLKEVFAKNPNASVLIISDAGTASGNFNIMRIEATEMFLREVYQHTLKVAWLNPMPADRWDGSSAYIICEMTDMFEATHEGLQKAIRLLKGKLKPKSVILYP